MSHVNIEIKAKCNFPDKIRNILKSHKADYKGTDQQIDTYFKVNSGRLKLREGNIENYLIHYQRSNQQGPKQSDVTLYKTQKDSSLKDVLIKSLDILMIVDKQREIYFIDNVKFHIDEVKDLGNFVEIEAIDYEDTIGKEKLLKQCQDYMDILGIKEDDLISNSYSDLILEANMKGRRTK